MWQAEKYEIMCISGEENNKSIHSCPVAKCTGISFVKVKGLCPYYPLLAGGRWSRRKWQKTLKRIQHIRHSRVSYCVKNADGYLSLLKIYKLFLILTFDKAKYFCYITNKLLTKLGSSVKMARYRQKGTRPTSSHLDLTLGQ